MLSSSTGLCTDICHSARPTCLVHCMPHYTALVLEQLKDKKSEGFMESARCTKRNKLEIAFAAHKIKTFKVGMTRRPISVSLVKLGQFPTKMKLARSTNVQYPSAHQVILNLESTNDAIISFRQFVVSILHTHLHDIPHRAPEQKQPFFTDPMFTVEKSLHLNHIPSFLWPFVGV